MTTTPDSTSDTLVIGAGLAGLTAAALLARSGHTVTVVDRGPIGGRATTTERNGFALNDGPHALYAGGCAMATLRSVGIAPSGVAPPIERARAWHDGSAAPLPTSPAGLLSTRLLGARSKLAAARVLPLLQKGRDDKAHGLTLAEWFERRRVPGDLRRMIEMYVRLTTYANAPEVFAADAALSQFALAQRGVLYLHDGWRQLVCGLRAAVEAHHGAVHGDRQVTALTSDGGTWAVVFADGGWAEASNVVIAAGGPRIAADLAGEDPGWVEGAGPPARAACLDLGVDREPDPPILLDTVEPLYGSTHSPPARLAPHGASLVGVMRYLAPGDDPDRDASRAALDDHARHMGVDVAHPRLERYLHRMTVAHGTPLGDRRRPTGGELASRRLWCAGDWVGPPSEGGAIPMLADAAVGSGATAARAILSRRRG